MTKKKTAEPSEPINELEPETTDPFGEKTDVETETQPPPAPVCNCCVHNAAPPQLHAVGCPVRIP